MHSPRSRPGGSSKNSSRVWNVFVRRVHQLVHHGYDRLQPATYAQTEETAITGDLVEAIDFVLSDRNEPWMVAFSVHDDPPVNNGSRKGKQRKRVDLRIDSGAFQPRARFRFESKRLGKRHTAKVYLGPEGLGCFLRGDYARDEDEAGMMGYVQSDDLDTWGNKIAIELTKSPTSYSVDPTLPFSKQARASTASSQAYCSRHHRLTVGRTILIDHVLLLFH